MAKSVVKGAALTALTRILTVACCRIAADVTGDMNVRFASAADTSRNVSSPPFSRDRPEERSSFVQILHTHQRGIF